MGIPYVTNGRLAEAAKKYDNLNDPYFEVIDCGGLRLSSTSGDFVRAAGFFAKCYNCKKIMMFQNYYIDDVLMPANVANCQLGSSGSRDTYCHFSTPYGEFFVNGFDAVAYIPNYIDLNFLPAEAAFETAVLASDPYSRNLVGYRLEFSAPNINIYINKCIVYICSKNQLSQVPCTLEYKNNKYILTFYAYSSDGSTTIDPHDCWLSIAG